MNDNLMDKRQFLKKAAGFTAGALILTSSGLEEAVSNEAQDDDRPKSGVAKKAKGLPGLVLTHPVIAADLSVIEFLLGDSSPKIYVAYNGTDPDENFYKPFQGLWTLKPGTTTKLFGCDNRGHFDDGVKFTMVDWDKYNPGPSFYQLANAAITSGFDGPQDRLAFSFKEPLQEFVDGKTLCESCQANTYTMPANLIHHFNSRLAPDKNDMIDKTSWYHGKQLPYAVMLKSESGTVLVTSPKAPKNFHLSILCGPAFLDDNGYKLFMSE